MKPTMKKSFQTQSTFWKYETREHVFQIKTTEKTQGQELLLIL